MILILKFIGTIIIISGVLIYGYGFHNIDIAFNCQYYNLSIDTSPTGIIKNCVQLHTIGLEGLIFGIIFIIIGLIFYGFFDKYTSR